MLLLLLGVGVASIEDCGNDQDVYVHLNKETSLVVRDVCVQGQGPPKKSASPPNSPLILLTFIVLFTFLPHFYLTLSLTPNSFPQPVKFQRFSPTKTIS